MLDASFAIRQRVHLIGIGGAGMLGLARFLVGMGHHVSGSDLRKSAETEGLSSIGVRVFYEHAADNVAGSELVVVSDAVPSNNPELMDARRRGIPILRRAECLARLCAGKKSVLVAGSHGKSSTSAMIARVLDTASAEPSFVIGAEIPSFDGQRARVGAGDYFVAEACEAFRNLDLFHSDISIITNIDNDHIEHYGSQARLDEAFADFANRSGPNGTVIVNGDDAGVRRILPRIDAPVTTFGLGAGNDVHAARHEFTRAGSQFEVWISGRRAGTIVMPVPGRHSIVNALACVAACRSLGLSFDDIARGLADFIGISRRWEDHGAIKGIQIIDDYAHHPTELRASIETARSLLEANQRLVIAFQPQLFSRTRRLYREFAEVLAEGDHVLLLQVDPAGERTTARISSALIADEMRKSRHVPDLFDTVQDFVDRAPGFLKPGDFLLIAGAGSIRSAARQLRERLREQPRPSRSRREELRPTAPEPTSVVSLFRAQVDGGPARPAVSDRGRGLSYDELDTRSDGLIALLEARNVMHGTVVAVGLPRSIDLIVAIVALAKMGACYLPLDGSLPRDRVRFMLSKAGCKVVITRSGSRIDAEICDTQKIHMDDVPSDSRADASRQAASSASPAPDDVAYICFTSGSTGYPKGVAIRHRSLLALMSDATSRFCLTTNSRMALNTSISFDVSLAEVWMTLCAGGQIVATGSATPLIGKALADFLENNAITHTTLTPSVLASVPFRPLPALTGIISIGEVCPQELADTWGRGRRFFNAYGPTETTIYATAAECRAGTKVTIGTALNHINTYVLDADGNQVRAGEAGELYLGGEGVADGYIDLPEETSARFSAFQRGGQKADWIYRTGDLVKLEVDGNLSFLGRVDNQIKLRGNRIELEEIESTIRRISGLEAVVCVEEWTGSKELICFIAVPSHDACDEDAMRAGLSGWLPSYMLPSQFIEVDSIPLTSSGKKDRRALLMAHRHRIGRPTRYRPAGGGAELASVWETFHIDPGEIERVLRAHEGVCQAAVLVRENQRGEPRSLVAYVQKHKGAAELSAADLTSFLGKRLPAYLIPSSVILTDDIPRLRDSTIDRIRLAQIDAAKIEETHDRVAAPLLKELTEIFEAVIGATGATPEDNVVSLGGDSLQAIHIAIELESRFGVAIPPEIFQEMPSILDLAQWIAAQDAAGISVDPV